MMVSNCLKFGSAKVCHGSAGEKNHKWFMKRMDAMTQMRLDLFASQVAKNYYEHELFKLAYRHVEEHCVKNLNVNTYDYGAKTCSQRKNYDDVKDMPYSDMEHSPEQLGRDMNS